MEAAWPGWNTEEILGEGSFGKVYRISKQEFGTTYEAALKLISIPQTKGDIQAAYAEGMDEASVTEYFKSCMEDIVAEFALMSQMKGNSNIVSYEDHMVVQHEDGIGWDILIRMELLMPLIQYAANNTLIEEDVIRMGIHLSRALKLCKKRGILHRDIKPENIFLTKDGDFKLGDFGVARVAEKTLSAMSRKGTYTYMAPEVYRGEEYGYTADIYSLGIVLYRFLNNNRTPFLPEYPQPIQFKDRENALNDRIMGKPMPEPSQGSAELKRIVMKACAFEPKDRYQSAAELEEELLGLQKQGSTNHMTADMDQAVADNGSTEKEMPREEGNSQNVNGRSQEEDMLDRTVSLFSTGQATGDRQIDFTKEETPAAADNESTEKEVSREDVKREQASNTVPHKDQAEDAVKENGKMMSAEKAFPAKADGKSNVKWGFAHAGNIIFWGIISGLLYGWFEDVVFRIDSMAVLLLLLFLCFVVPAAAMFFIASLIHKKQGVAVVKPDIICEIIVGIISAPVTYLMAYLLYETDALNDLTDLIWDIRDAVFGSSTISFDDTPVCFAVGFMLAMILAGLLMLLWSKTMKKKLAKKLV